MSATFPQFARTKVNSNTDVCNNNDGHSRGWTEQWADFREYFKQWKHAKVLFATAASWFLLYAPDPFSQPGNLTDISSDIAYYGINLNQSIILARINYAEGATPWDTLYKTAVGNIIVQVAVSSHLLSLSFYS